MQPTVSVPSLIEVKNLIDYRLSEYCKVRTQAASQIGEQYAALWSAIETLLTAGGKRFRPYMLITAFSAYASDDADIESILPAALAQELSHQAMLIHDDIIDRDTIRYGVKNISGQYDSNYKPFIKAPKERAHMALSTALLAGDVLLSDSYHFLSRVTTTPERQSQVSAIFSSGLFEVIGGELLDTQTSFLTNGVTSQTIARFKTASYSFISPLSIGAILAGASAEQVGLLRQLAEYLGIGYQLRDDLLGTFGSEAETGKSTSTDITEGKRTYLIEQFELLGTEAQKNAFSKLFHTPALSQSDLNTAKNLLVESGAKAQVEMTIDTLRTKSENIISLLTISDETKEVFNNLIQDCLAREK
jgi:geranylgeranyl diphosphate synthase type II